MVCSLNFSHYDEVNLQFFPPYGYDLCSEKSVTNLDCDQPRL